MKNLICNVCANGCYLKVDEDNNFAVIGNKCVRGEIFAKNEFTNPTRVVISKMNSIFSESPICSVRTDKAILKSQVYDVMVTIEKTTITKHYTSGAIIIENICNTGANLIAMRNI